jgi:quercetin dioxygenase-like cupin family protein
MSLHDKALRAGKLAGVIFDFDEVGDVLPMHKHGVNDVHITIVARGSFRAHGPGWERMISAGDVLDWAVDQYHEFIATAPNSRLVNVIKGGGSNNA